MTMHIFIVDHNLTIFSSCNDSVFLANEKAWFIYSAVKVLSVYFQNVAWILNSF